MFFAFSKLSFDISLEPKACWSFNFLLFSTNSISRKLMSSNSASLAILAWKPKPLLASIDNLPTKSTNCFGVLILGFKPIDSSIKESISCFASLKNVGATFW